eukprot:5273581-Pyramimonas_sp.AAC.1
MLSADLVAKYPKIVAIGTAALNHKAALEMTEMEGIMTMYSHAVALMTAGTHDEDAAWEAARAETIKQEPL